MKTKSLLLMTAALLISNALAPAQPALKDVFKNEFLVGAALNTSQFTGSNAADVRIVQRQFNSISPENALKWENVHPRPGVFDFSLPDRYVAFGEANHMFIIGHTLVWHEQTPGWVFRRPDGSNVDRDTLLNCLSNHIFTVVGRYQGRIKGWDVVNEAVNEDGTLRHSPWLKIIGPDYLVKAYQFAHAADPQAELYYNDFSIEKEPKRSGVVALVRNLQAAGVHLTAVGMQEHVRLDWPPPRLVSEAITAFSRLGVKVSITELDVDVLPPAFAGNTADVSINVARRPELNPYPHGLPVAIQTALARRYAQLFAVYVKHHNEMERVTFWGVNDGDSWLNDWPVRGRTSYPLLFDRADRPKPAFASVVQAARSVTMVTPPAFNESASLNQP
jgi:endo-1,4-beta-xylanase